MNRMSSRSATSPWYLILGLVGIASGVVAIIASVGFVHLFLTAAQINWAGVPTWFNTSNFFGWVVGGLVFALVLAILKATVSIFQTIVFFPVKGFVTSLLLKDVTSSTKKARNIIIAIVTISLIITVTLASIATVAWFGFMSNHADLSSFFGEPSFIAYAGTFLLFTSILEGESKKKNEN